VFSGILKIKFGLSEGMGNFAVYLFCGLVPWLGFSEAVQRSSSLMLDQRALIKRVFLPKVIFPLSLTISTFLVQIATLLVYLVVIYFLKYECGRAVLLLPLIFPIQIMFTFGFCLLVSSLNVFFRDIGVFVGTLLTLWFFCTPIFYPESIIPERFVPFMDINPMLHLVRIYRHLIL
jgi:ABC-type polysaccharide/polyol phosphate export permease